MKTLSKLALLIAFTSTAPSFAAVELNLEALTGIYKLEVDNAGGNCPNIIRVSQKTEFDLEVAAVGASAQMVYADINGDKEELKVSAKETYQIKSEATERGIRMEGRMCRNKIFKKCTDWDTLSMLYWGDDGIAISNKDSVFLPASGFPAGTCSYSKGSLF